MLLWRMGFREMVGHPGRALLTLLSVVIGVAAVVAVGLSTASAGRAYQEMYEAITGRAALQVVGVGGEGVDGSLLAIVRAFPGVLAAIPQMERPAILYHGDRRVKVLAMGIDASVDETLRGNKLVEGESFREGKGVLLDVAFARGLGVRAGDQVRLLARSGQVRTTVVGLVRPTTGAAVSHGGVLFMPLDAAQRRFGAVGRVDQIQVVLKEDADLDRVQKALTSKLPPGVEVRPPATRSQLADETMLALQNGLEMATAFSLLAAVFIIMNTFQMNVGQRRKQLAMLRAIGATKRQIGALLYREAILMAAAGTVFGILLGLGGARLLTTAMGTLFQTPMPSVEMTPVPFLLGAVFGFGVSLVGALLPALQAARLTPLEGMNGIARSDVEGFSPWILIGGLCIVGAAAAVFAAIMRGWLVIEHAPSALVLGLVGVVFLLPSALRPLTHLAALALSPLARAEAQLASRQLLRHRGRTTLTVGVLFVAVSTAMGLASCIIDNVEDVRAWYREMIVADLIVRATNPDMNTGLSAAVPDGVGEEIRAVPNLERAGTLRFVSVKAQGQPAIAIAYGNLVQRDPAQPSTRRRVFVPQGDDVFIGSVLAQRTGLKVGDDIVIAAIDGPAALRVSKVVNDYLGGGLTLHMRRELAERLLKVQGVDAYAIEATREHLPKVEKALLAICDDHGLLLQSYADLTSLIEVMMAGVVGSLWGLLTLGLFVAAFGIVNTLGMNVLEQTRELGLLRVVAMTRWQIRKMILAQGGMLALLAVVPGLGAGLLMAYLINLATMPVIGHPVAFAFHPVLMASGFAVTLLMVLFAAWLPAERAARLRLALALRYE